MDADAPSGGRLFHAAAQADAFFKMARGLMAENKPERARTLLERVLTLSKGTDTGHRSRFVRGAHYVGYIHFIKGRFSDAVANAQMAYTLQQVAMQNGDAGECRCFVYISAASAPIFVLGYHTGKAIEALDKSVSAAQACYEPNSLRFADALEAISTGYSGAGQFGTAEQVLRQVLDIRKAKLGENDALVAQTYVHLATLYAYDRDFREFDMAYKRALAIREVVFGLTSKEVARTLRDMWWFYRCLGYPAEADTARTRLFAIVEEGDPSYSIPQTCPF